MSAFSHCGVVTRVSLNCLRGGDEWSLKSNSMKFTDCISLQKVHTKIYRPFPTPLPVVKARAHLLFPTHTTSPPRHHPWYHTHLFFFSHENSRAWRVWRGKERRVNLLRRTMEDRRLRQIPQPPCWHHFLPSHVQMPFFPCIFICYSYFLVMDSGFCSGFYLFCFVSQVLLIKEAIDSIPNHLSGQMATFD